ncbi:MAG: hypothetical protein KC478_05830 [Bacteriovoracaceae bacterium]|nr:hypothetical protein [Bacteriovoracaceae bacterium]
MDLLIFAHRGEAQQFIKRLSLKASEDTQGLYVGENTLLLITGEGIYEVFAKLGLVLGQYPISRAFNIGIAGSLSEKIELGKVYEVKTAYNFTQKVQFQSFTLSESAHAKDTITSSERVLTNESASELSNFAPIVDREVWAVAKTCAAAGVELRSYKLISDVAGEQTDCFDLKQKALEFSTTLLEFWLGLEHNETPFDDSISYPIQMSFTQKAKYQKLVDSLSLNTNFDHKTFATDFLNSLGDKYSSKQKANLLLERMELGLNPVKLATKESFEKLSMPAKEIGATLLFDKNFEKKKFTLQMEINDQKNIENLSKLSEALNFSDFEKIWNGSIDV